MGFWSSLADLAVSVMEGMNLTQAHPALQKAWDRYVAKGYQLVSVDTYELTGQKEGMFSVSTVTLRVDADGSVLVEEEGALTSNVYVIPPGPRTPTIAEFEAAREETRPSQEQLGSSSNSPSSESTDRQNRALGSSTLSVSSTRIHQHSDGNTVEITLNRQPIEGDAWYLRLADEGHGTWLRGKGQYVDEEGDFTAGVRVFAGEKSVFCFVPKGAVGPLRGRPLQGRLFAVVGDELGEAIDFSLGAQGS